MTRSLKGFQFERDLCKRLSLWWTNGESDCVFWRTSCSGGRATNRGKQGKKTKGQYGDICATDPTGQPLLDLLTLEVKRGYNKHTIADLLDRSDDAADQLYERWIKKAIHDHEQAGSFSWMLIVKRDRREPIVILPAHVFKKLSSCLVIWEICLDGSIPWLELVACKLASFLHEVSPETIQQVLKKLNSRPYDGDES